MKYRKLRIAWSVGWGVACLLVIVLCVRSYSQWDTIYGTPFGKHMIVIQSVLGHLQIMDNEVSSSSPWNWSSSSNPTVQGKFISADGDRGMAAASTLKRVGIKFAGNRRRVTIDTPHWFPVVLFATLGAIPWVIPWRFSLRTLLIVMTVAAIGLGWLVYAIRK